MSLVQLAEYDFIGPLNEISSSMFSSILDSFYSSRSSIYNLLESPYHEDNSSKFTSRLTRSSLVTGL